MITTKSEPAHASDTRVGNEYENVLKADVRRSEVEQAELVKGLADRILWSAREREKALEFISSEGAAGKHYALTDGLSPRQMKDQIRILRREALTLAKMLGWVDGH